MLKSIEKALRLSEIREQLNGLNAIAEPTDAQQTEERDLLASQKKTETEYRAALTEEADEHATVPVDAEDRAYRAVLARGSIGRIMTACVEHRSTDGADAELQQHRGLNGESDPARHAATACGRASRRHDRTHERRHDRATGDPSRLRGGRGRVPDGHTANRPGGRSRVPDPRPAADRGRAAYGQHGCHDETSGSFSSSLLAARDGSAHRIRTSGLTRRAFRGSIRRCGPRSIRGSKSGSIIS